MNQRQLLVILFSFGIITLLLWIAWRRENKISTHRKRNSSPHKFHELRSMAFSVTPESIGITASSFPGKVWGIVMETGLPNNGLYTLLVFADGTTSLYLSNGTCFIGCGQQQQVRVPSEHFLALADKFFDQSTLTETYSLPLSGEVRFYFRCFDGMRTYAVVEADLAHGKDEFSELLYAGHAVITEIRRTWQTKEQT